MEKEKEIEFIGRITAGATHEYMNVFATIREASGLMEDILSMDLESTFPHKVKFSEKISAVLEQVNRGMEISTNLNTFAHSMDESKVQIEVNDLLAQFAYFMRHFLRINKIKLTVEPVEPPLTIYTDPFRLLLVLTTCLEFLLNKINDQDMIVLKCTRSEKGVAIQYTSRHDLSLIENGNELPEGLMDLKDTLERLDARIVHVNLDNQFGLEIILPESI